MLDKIKQKASDYNGSFVGRDTCYSITDIQFNCRHCGKKQFLSRASVVDCMGSWKQIPKKGINILCKCGWISTQVDINITDIMKEIREIQCKYIMKKLKTKGGKKQLTDAILKETGLYYL